jgi:type IV pilus assembly protein PilP
VVEPYEPFLTMWATSLTLSSRPRWGRRRRKAAVGFRPDLDRPKEPLELYPLESLKYVGVMTRKKVSYAIIQVDGTLYQIKIGNYMGQNFRRGGGRFRVGCHLARTHPGFRG